MQDLLPEVHDYEMYSVISKWAQEGVAEKYVTFFCMLFILKVSFF